MTFKILAIDGGGIRGIIPAKVLVRLEAILKSKIGDAFDLIAGTSTGAVLACGLLMPVETDADDKKEIRSARFSAEHLLDMYIEDGKTIFPPDYFHSIGFRASVSSSVYPTESGKGIDAVLERYFKRRT